MTSIGFSTKKTTKVQDLYFTAAKDGVFYHRGTDEDTTLLRRIFDCGLSVTTAHKLDDSNTPRLVFGGGREIVGVENILSYLHSLMSSV